jgi:hypothetical protein
VGLIHGLGKLLAHPTFGSQPQWAVAGETYPLGCRFAPQIGHAELFSSNPDRRRRAFGTPEGVYAPGCGLKEVYMSWGAPEYLYLVMVLNQVALPEEALFILRCGRGVGQAGGWGGGMVAGLAGGLPCCHPPVADPAPPRVVASPHPRPSPPHPNHPPQRYQKFYSLTRPGGAYRSLLSPDDVASLPLLSAFQRLAVYKRVELPPQALTGEAAMAYYDALIARYIGHDKLFW